MTQLAAPPPRPPATRGRRARALAFAGAGILLVVGIAVVAGSIGLDGPQLATGEERGAAVAAPGTSRETRGAPDPVDKTGAEDAAVGPTPPTVPATSESPEAGPAPAHTADPEPAGAGIEVLPLTDTLSVLPPSEALPDLLQNAAPASATANGRLVEGIPGVISPAPQSTVVSSAVNTNGETVTASLAATTEARALDILAHYEKSFGAVGLTATPTTQAAGDIVQTFYRGNDSVTLTVSTEANRNTPYALHGIFSAVQ